MEYFLLSQNESKIEKQIPRLKKYTKESFRLNNFPLVNELGRQEFRTITPNSLSLHYNEGIEICYVIKGKFEWEVEGEKYFLYPGDSFITCPWQIHGSPNKFVDLGVLTWIIIKPVCFDQSGELFFDGLLSLFENEMTQIGTILAKNKMPIFHYEGIGGLLENLYKELKVCKIGYETRVRNILEELLIGTVRSIQEQKKQSDEYSVKLEKLKSDIENDITAVWTVQEMAYLVNMGTTVFNEKIKKYTGYTPIQFLTNIRLSKAKSMLTNLTINLTTIALECGFYSSQYFSYIFKRWTGVSPKDFRKQNT